MSPTMRTRHGWELVDDGASRSICSDSPKRPSLDNGVLKLPSKNNSSNGLRFLLPSERRVIFSIMLRLAGTPTGQITVSLSPSGHDSPWSNSDPLNVAAIQQVPNPSCRALSTTCSKRKPAESAEASSPPIPSRKKTWHPLSCRMYSACSRPSYRTP